MPKSCCKDTKTTLSVDEHSQQEQAHLTFAHFDADFNPLPYNTLTAPTEKLNPNLDVISFVNTDTGPPKIPLYLQYQKLLI